MQPQHPRTASLQRGDSDSEDSHHDEPGDSNTSQPASDSRSKGYGDKKGTINRVNRACNNCRRMKMRCVGAEDPPCKRCKNAGLQCVMEKPGRSGDAGVGEDRVRSLESQVSEIQNTLTDLVSTLRAGLLAQPPPMPPPQTSTPDFRPSNSGFNVLLPTASPLHQTEEPPNVSQSVPQLPFWALPEPERSSNDVSFSLSNFATGQNFGFPPKQEIIVPPKFANDGSEPGSTPSFQTHPSPFVPSVPGGMPGLPSETTRRDDPAPFSWPAQLDPHTKSPHISLPPSRAGSVGPEDILGPEEITNPLGAMSSMAGLVEAAVERAREERNSPVNHKRGPDGGVESRPVKKTRFSPPDPTGPAITEAQNLPPTITNKERKKSKRTHIHAYPDAVAEGYVSEAEGRELMRIFYAGSSNFIPCFDPNVDQWDALRMRSPFSLTAIMMVGARVRDGGGPPSDVQKACRAHAQRIAVGTLFNPVARIEAVQAMTILASFSESGWLPGGHAVRMAIDMGVNRSFIHLLRSGMGKGKSREELEEERHLVVHSRVWFCLYLVEHQMAYGMGRPAILREDETIHNCRRLLEHPLSITSDARLVSTVELMALRAPLHIELTASPDLPLTVNTLKRLKQANSDFDAWERYWDRILSDRFAKGRGDFFRESLIIQRQYAELFVNSQLLRGIREPADVISMPEEQRTLAIRAMRNAQRCLEICLRGENYRNGLRYAVHYTHVCAAFAASFLIRIARLFPHELNLKKTAKDVEELAEVLSDIPAGRYARSLRLILRRARRAKVIPAPSAVASPKAAPLQLPNESNLPAFSPSQLVNPAYYPTPATGSINLQTGQIINDSPSSGGDNFEFDSLFAQETLERAGLKMGEGDQLPLFLDGQSLGATAAPTEMTPYVGIESFFLPAEVDNRLSGPNGADGTGHIGQDYNPLAGDVWW